MIYVVMILGKFFLQLCYYMVKRIENFVVFLLQYRSSCDLIFLLLFFRYVYDGVEVLFDFFILMVSDGINRVIKVVEVDIVLLDDIVFLLKNNFWLRFIVFEGGDVIVMLLVLVVIDEDIDDGGLIFLIVKQFKYGIM